MAIATDSSLGALREQAKQLSDMEANPFVLDHEWNMYISQSRKELMDLIIGAYGNDYYVANTYNFTTTSAQAYPLPDGSSNFVDSTGSTAQAFYKLLGVDLQYSASPSGYVSLRRFEFIERNKYAYPNTFTSYVGYTNLRYRLQGGNLFLVPIPTTGQTIRVWYIPAPTPVSYLLPCATTLSNTTVTTANTTGLTAGMQVYATNLAANTTVVSVSTTSVVLSSQAQSTKSSQMIYFWDDSTIVDGIAGWEEYVIIDAAMKAIIKQEGDPQVLMIQKAAMTQRVEQLAEGRDAGQSYKVSDVMGSGGFGMGDY